MAKSVLIVDDSVVVRRALRRLFESEADFDTLREAASGQEAIDRAQELQPDLIVIDFAMPVMNGLEAAQLLRKSMPLVPIILYSAFSDALVEEEARSAGISAVISKSDHVSTLITKARSLCMRKAA
jgi:CheY-like chemotaxis protein